MKNGGPHSGNSSQAVKQQVDRSLGTSQAAKQVHAILANGNGNYVGYTLLVPKTIVECVQQRFNGI